MEEAFPANKLLASATIDRLRHHAYCLRMEAVDSGRDPKVPPPPVMVQKVVVNGSQNYHA